MLHLKLGDVLGHVRGFLPEVVGGDDFLEGADGHLVGDPAGWVLHGAVEDREFEVVFGSEHTQFWHIWRMRSSALSPP